MVKKKLLELEKQLRGQNKDGKGRRLDLSDKIGIDPSTLSRLINCKSPIEEYKQKIYEYIRSYNPSVDFDELFKIDIVEENGKTKPENYDSAFAKRVRIAIEKLKVFKGYKSDNDIIERSGKLISVHALSDYKNGYYECRSDQLEPLATTLNVVPQFLSGEIALPYDHYLKPFIERLIDPYPNRAYSALTKALNNFLFELYAYSFNSIDSFPEPKTDIYIKAIIESFLQNMSIESKTSYDEIIRSVGSPSEILSSLIKKNNGIYKVSSLQESTQIQILNDEMNLFEWYRKKNSLLFSDLLFLNRYIGGKIENDEIKKLYHDYLHLIFKAKRIE